MKRVCLAAIIAACLIQNTYAQQACGPEKSILEFLRDSFSEHPVWRGRADDFKFILTRNDDGGWTLVRVSKGIACLIAGGRGSYFDRGV